MSLYHRILAINITTIFFGWLFFRDTARIAIIISIVLLNDNLTVMSCKKRPGIRVGCGRSNFNLFVSTIHLPIMFLILHSIRTIDMCMIAEGATTSEYLYYLEKRHLQLWVVTHVSYWLSMQFWSSNYDGPCLGHHLCLGCSCEKVLRNNERMSDVMQCKIGTAIFILPIRQY